MTSAALPEEPDENGPANPEDAELARMIMRSGMDAKEIRAFIATLTEVRSAPESQEPAPRSGYE